MACENPINCRGFLARSGAVPAVAATAVSAAAEDVKPVRIGFVGAGFRGSYLVKVLASMPGVGIPALCDINSPNPNRVITVVNEANGKAPEGYDRD